MAYKRIQATVEETCESPRRDLSADFMDFFISVCN